MDCVHDMFMNLRKMFEGNHQHLSSFLCQGVSGNRPGQNTFQIQYFDASKRAVPFWEQNSVAIRNFCNFSNRFRVQHLPMWMYQPLRVRSYHAQQALALSIAVSKSSESHFVTESRT